MKPRVEILGLPAPERARLRSSRALAAALGALPAEGPASARLSFADDNGPKGGPAMRCALTVALPPRRRFHVEARAATARLALDMALDRLKRKLGRSNEIMRDSRRRPKKYYAAARAQRSVAR
jgi:hypothetical protein